MSIAWIDGKPWRVCLPTGGRTTRNTKNDWDNRLKKLSEDNTLASLHWDNLGFWCRDIAQRKNNVTFRTVRGYEFAKCWLPLNETAHFHFVGFRPDLVPLTEALEFDAGYLSRLKDGETVTFGTLYMNDSPITLPVLTYEDLAEIHIGNSDAHFDKQIRWIKCGKRLFSDRVLITDISWIDLERNGLTVEPEGGAAI